MIYSYTRHVVPELLTREIKASAVGQYFNSLSFDGTTVNIDSNTLTGSQVATLDGVVAAHADDPTLLVYEKAVDDAIEFGEDLIKEYGLKNIMRGYTATQIVTVANDLSLITNLLRSGAIETAKSQILAFVPTAEVVQADKDEFLTKIDAYLGV